MLNRITLCLPIQIGALKSVEMCLLPIVPPVRPTDRYFAHPGQQIIPIRPVATIEDQEPGSKKEGKAENDRLCFHFLSGLESKLKRALFIDWKEETDLDPP